MTLQFELLNSVGCFRHQLLLGRQTYSRLGKLTNRAVPSIWSTTKMGYSWDTNTRSRKPHNADRSSKTPVRFQPPTQKTRVKPPHGAGKLADATMAAL